MEHIQLLGLSPKSCPVCEVPPDELEHFHEWGTYIARNYQAYIEQFEEADNLRPKAKRQIINNLKEKSIIGMAEVFSNLGLDISTLHKQDLLHGIYLGMVEYILGLLEEFLKKHK